MIRVHGKVILAGEHTVVRGGPAIVTPLRSRGLELRWEDAPKFQVQEGPFREATTHAFEKAAEILGLPLPAKFFHLSSTIPPRAGLGSSAALSVAIARYFSPPEIFPLALELENIFHGKSSGLDVAAVVGEANLYFQHGKVRALPTWQPPLYISDTSLRSSTKECVAQVSRLTRLDLDERMAESVREIERAFLEENPAALASGMEEAAVCFREWDLVPPEIARAIEALKLQGARAVKPTGSGNGGFLLSLWDAPPALPSLIPLC